MEHFIFSFFGFPLLLTF